MPRAPLQYEIQRRLTFVTQRWGVEVLRVTLDEITLLDKVVRQRLLDAWDIEWHREVELGRVDTEVMKLLKQLEGKRGEAQAKAETEMMLADSKGYGNTVEGRSQALARVEYVLQLLKAFGGLEELLNRPDILRMIVSLAAFTDIDNAPALAGLLANLSTLGGSLEAPPASKPPEPTDPGGQKPAP